MISDIRYQQGAVPKRLTSWEGEAVISNMDRHTGQQFLKQLSARKICYDFEKRFKKFLGFRGKSLGQYLGLNSVGVCCILHFIILE